MPSGPAALVGSRLRQKSAYKIPSISKLLHTKLFENLENFFQIQVFQSTRQKTLQQFGDRRVAISCR